MAFLPIRGERVGDNAELHASAVDHLLHAPPRVDRPKEAPEEALPRRGWQVVSYEYE